MFSLSIEIKNLQIPTTLYIYKIQKMDLVPHKYHREDEEDDLVYLLLLGGGDLALLGGGDLRLGGGLRRRNLAGGGGGDLPQRRLGGGDLPRLGASLGRSTGAQVTS